MAKKNAIIPIDRNVIELPIEEAMPDNYLPYAVEVAKDRALPDVRDGLKPVHRRILYGAYALKAFPDRPYYKSARIVGDILGKFHPHGDSSVYDAMVILAQDFTTNCTLIDGHGNWGSIDGDGAAAMRYTEARLSNIALEMLRDIDKDTVDMMLNYSDSEIEPKVLPSRYPNLLVNGTFGIAVGLATNIPPHNLSEVIDATCSYIDNPEMTTRDLLEYIKGPDLPTGGELIGKESMLSAYRTGTGKVVLRAKTHIETLDSGRMAIIITEFPYKQNKAKILQMISDMTGDKAHAKSLELITDIRDESDREGIRAVIEFKKSATQDSIEKVLKYLLKKTPLQSNISFNMVAIANEKPETLSLKAMLKYYIEHQKEVIKRRTETELKKAEERYHIVEGYMKAISIMDKVVETIRKSKSKTDSIANLVNEYDFSNAQSESIVSLRLYRLTNLELNAFNKEYKELTKSIKRLKEILNKEKVLLDLLKSELNEIKEKYGTPRKTVVIDDEEQAKIHVDEILIDEDVIVTQSNDGFIKRLPIKSYNRSNTDVSEIEYREGDFNKFLYNSNTKENLLFFTDKGLMYKTKCLNIPEAKWKEKGIRLSEIIKGINIEEENIISVASTEEFKEDKAILFVTEKGNFKKISLNKLATNYTKLVATKLKGDDILVGAIVIDKKDSPINLSIKTEKGFNFNILENMIDETDKNVLPAPFISIAPNDKVISCSVEEIEEDKEFYIGYNSDFVIDIQSDSEVNKKFNYKVNKEDYIFAVTDTGNVLSLPCYMLQKSKSIDFKSLIDDNIVSLMVIPSESINTNALYFFSKKGNIKKTKLEEFINMVYVSGYKFKDDDTIISADYGTIDETDIFIFTKQGMCLKFKDNSFTSTSKNAGGVTAIRLKDDEVVVGITNDNNKSYSVHINKDKKSLNFENIEYKNRGTKGVEIKSEIHEVAISLA